LAGSYALSAYGAPEPSHDVDLVVAESDVVNAEATPSGARFTVEHPPEDWLFKARTGDTVVDVLHRINGIHVGQAIVDGAEARDVLAITMPVLAGLDRIRAPPRTITRSRSWYWPSGSASPADGAGHWLR
jgi:hypothetical protein